MAIPEACGVWIEQRVQEELDRKKESGASLREIGRVVAAEVEKYFETKVHPRTIEKRAGRMSATNVAPQQSQTNTVGKGGDSGDKTTTQEAVKEVEKEVKKGVSARSAVKKVSHKTGKSEDALRKAHQRHQAKQKPKPQETAPEPILWTCR